MDESVVIFDTVVFVRALLNPYSLWGRLVFDHYHEYRLIVTPQLDFPQFGRAGQRDDRRRCRSPCRMIGFSANSCRRVG